MGNLRVVDLVGLHLLEDGARLLVVARDLGEVLVEMVLHLTLGLHDEAEAPFVAGQPGRRAHREGARIPQRVQETLAVPQVFQARGTPGEVIVFFLGGALQALARVRQLGGQRLTLIEGLGANLAGVVDPHQACDVPPLLVGKVRLRDVLGRVGAFGGLRAPEQGPQCVIGVDQDLVDRRQTACRHGFLRSKSDELWSVSRIPNNNDNEQRLRALFLVRLCR